MAVPNTFASATTSIPLANLDANFSYYDTAYSISGTAVTYSGTLTVSALTASTSLALNASKQLVSVTNTGSGNNVLATSPTLVTPILGTPTSGNFSTGTFTWPTFNQNTTGTAANVTGVVAVANGGTGLSTTHANGALDIGNGTGFTRATLTAGTGISVTNTAGAITIAATSSGGVTSVTGTSPVASSGGTTPAISLAAGYGDTLNPYASKTANWVLAAPNGAAGVPVFRAIVAADIPTLNQNTSGTSAGLTGSPNVTLGTILAGNSQLNSLGIGTAASGTAGEIRAINNITAYYSDDRLKTKLGNIQDALAKVKTLSGFYYEANQTAQDLGYEPIREVGVSAQQVQSVLPEVVVPAPIDEKYLTVRYEKLIPLLIEAIKELDAKIEGLVKP
jgi:hypothetical protein